MVYVKDLGLGFRFRMKFIVWVFGLRFREKS